MPSDRMLNEVEVHVPERPCGQGLTANEIHKLVDCWSVITVRQALSALAVAGRVVFDGPKDKHRRYRKVSQ